MTRMEEEAQELGADGETSFVYPPLLRCDVRY